MNLMLELIKIGVNQAKFRTRAGTDRRRWRGAQSDKGVV